MRVGAEEPRFTRSVIRCAVCDASNLTHSSHLKRRLAMHTMTLAATIYVSSLLGTARPKAVDHRLVDIEYHWRLAQFRGDGGDDHLVITDHTIADDPHRPPLITRLEEIWRHSLTSRSQQSFSAFSVQARCPAATAMQHNRCSDQAIACFPVGNTCGTLAHARCSGTRSAAKDAERGAQLV